MNKFSCSIWSSLAFVALFGWNAFAQDSVDVTFRYNISGTPSGLTVPGQFNAWNNTAWPMTYQGGTLWTRDARLAVGGAPSPIAGAFQYKFFFTGASPWPNDPLNHHVNVSDNDNTFIIVKNPTIYHFLPNNRTGTVTTNFPTISAFIFPKVGTAFDTSGLALTINGTTYTGIGSSYNFTTREFRKISPTSLGFGNHIVILRAGTTLDTVSFIVQTGPPPSALMPSYAAHSVTLPAAASNDSTTFRLRVSTSYALLRIAPLGQPLASAPAYFLRKNFTSDDWWINVKLLPGTYEYQYQVANGASFNDPWGRWNGTQGSRFTVGAEGLTADDYVWRSNSYQKPPPNKLIIYEMNVGEFTGGYYGLTGGQGTFSHLSRLMGYFDSLGVNALELMPVNDYGLIGRSGFSWGYDISHHFALEPGYGAPRDFKALVDSAHAHGIAIIIDAVFNHLNDPGPLWQMHPDVGGTNPYFKLCSERRYNEDDLCFFRDMDHFTPQTQEYVLEVLKMWIDVYRVDGFRYDFTQGIGWNINEPTMGILGWANKIDTLYQGRVYQIAEHLPESPALVFYSGMTGGWHDSFRDEVFDEARFQNRTLDRLENLVLDLGAYGGNDTPALPNRYASRTEPINGNVNHDEQSLIFEMNNFQGVPIDVAVQRDKLYAPFMFASLGIPMLWQGMENGEPRGWDPENQKLSYRPVQFSLRSTPRGQAHYRWYKALILQRKRNPALYNGQLRTLFRYNAEKTLVWGFEDIATNSRFVAVSNFTSAQQTISTVPWIGSGTFYNILDQTTLVVSGGSVPSITIPAYTSLCYSSIPDSMLLDVEPMISEIPTEFSLNQNYPNPFNPSTRIAFSVQVSGFTSLRIFDVLGREVATLVNEQLAAGKYELPFDARGLSSGVYFYKLVSGSFVETKRMMLTK